MRLESALYTSREGLSAHGQALGVIGDNIANANTVAYKASRPEFADLLSEGTEGRSSYAIVGGGSGVQVERIRVLHEAGVSEFTGRALDVAITGEGFFMVGNSEAPTYTRAGNFQLNAEGVLTTSDGLPVLGFQGEGTTVGELDMDAINLAGNASATVTLSGNLDATSAVTAAPANPATFREVAAAASFTNGATVYDSLGQEHNITLAFFRTGNNTWTAQAYIDGADVGGEAGVPVQVGQDLNLTFNAFGQMEEADQANAIITAAPAYANGAAAGNFAINLSGFSQYAQTSQISSITQDGQGAGEISGYEFGSDGSVLAVLSSGSRVLVGTLALRNFTNLEGLTRVGNNNYITTAEAGELDPGTPGTNGLGTIEGGALERSSVDIANQFVDLIVYQRGYQASSQTLGVASTLLRDTLGLIR
ncbi:MAG: flagellar hook protein FlgE [Deltaproteobacteria bacterium]|nr:flagellar hook protein FlgE [Deltaproteobacteria bacterium]